MNSDFEATLVVFGLLIIIVFTTFFITTESGDWYNKGVIDCYNGVATVSIIEPDIYQIYRPILGNKHSIVMYDYNNDNSAYIFKEKEWPQ